MHQFNQHRQATKSLEKLFAHPEGAVVIHYSCESFADRPDGKSPRVTSIAVRNLATALTVSFSIHQVAERLGVPPGSIAEQYDRLEKTMLREFYDYVSKNSNQTWVHWNMRDINYGFPALAHRFKVLGGTPIELPPERLFDVARVLVMKYGVSYMKHPRLENLIKLNGITTMNFLPGGDEAKAFDAGEYVRLHQSTLRKVDNIANIVEQAHTDRLKTYSTWRERHGVSFAEMSLAIQRHWLAAILIIIIGVMGSVFTILGISVKDWRHQSVPSTPTSRP